MRIGEQLVGIVPVAKIRNSQQLLKKTIHTKANLAGGTIP